MSGTFLMTNYFTNLLSRRLKTVISQSIRHVKWPYPDEFSGPERHVRWPRPEETSSLAERLAALEAGDPEVSALVNIGLPKPLKTGETSRRPAPTEAERDALLNAAVTRTLKVDLEKVQKDWERHGLLDAVHDAATHYGIYKDLYDHGYFVPRVPLHVVYPNGDTLVTPVRRGNIITASEASQMPEVTFVSDPSDMWTLVLTNPDGHLKDSRAEYIHWFITNIKGGDLTTGEELVPYLQPFPPRGTGYHRLVFVLYKQDKGNVFLEFPKKINHSYNLKERTFRTFDFYKAHQDVLTPAGMCFCQVTWDSSVKHVFHNLLEMREPVFEYYQKPKPVEKQVIYPYKEPFNKYLDRYRDPKEMREEVLLKRLKTLDPFKEEAPLPKYPNLHMDFSLPSWYIPERWKENNRIGRYRDLRPHSVFEQKDFDYERDMHTKKAGDDEPFSN